MKRIGLILLGMLMVGVVSAEVKKIKGTGYLVVHDRQADQPFTRVSVQQSITLYISQGKTEGITVEADDNIIPYIKTEIKNGQLNIFLDPEVIVRGYTTTNLSGSKSSRTRASPGMTGSPTFPSNNRMPRKPMSMPSSRMRTGTRSRIAFTTRLS